jgi:hypothetical protein
MPSRKKKASNIHATLVKRLPLLLPLLVGMVLVYLGLIIRGLDVGSCPTLGFNGVTAPCFHNFAGTDIPITSAGNIVIIIGTVLVVTTAALALCTQSLRKDAK